MWKYEELFSQLKRALELMKEQDMTGAEVLLMEVKEKLERNEECKELEGEWNLLMAMHHFLDPDAAIPYLQKARSMIGGRSKVVPYGTAFPTDVYGPLFMFLKKPGTADETGEKLEQMMEFYDFLCGGVSRCDQLYFAQLAFYRGEFEKAQSLFLKADGIAKKTGNLLDQICIAEYRARMAVHLLDPVLWKQSADFLNRMQNQEDRVLREISTCMKSKIQMGLGMMSGIPKWITSGKFGAISDGDSYRIVEDHVSHRAFPIAWMTYMEYLLYSGDFYRVINGADIAASLYGLDSTMLYNCYLWLYKASAWDAIGDRKRAVPYLNEARDLLMADRMGFFGTEFFPVLGEDLLQKMDFAGTEEMDRYLKVSREYSGKLPVLRKMITETGFRESLTEKEQEVAHLAAIGYKNEEIGEKLSISRNTVKYHLANAYKKLGIQNRVELKNAMEMLTEQEFAYWTGLLEKEKN